jgi:protein-tyrosine phosphatase
MKHIFQICAALVLAILPTSINARFVDIPTVSRESPTSVKISWGNADPVAVYQGSTANDTLATAKLLGTAKDGQMLVPIPVTVHPYFILLDKRDQQQWRVAERLLPLEKGSNFRDVGGYTAAGGKHVRWGMIFRSAGQPMLSDTDLKLIGGLRLQNIVDLRSSEERVLAPTKINGIPYTAVGYSFTSIVGSGPAARNGLDTYRRMPTLLAPQLRIIFHDLLGRQAPLAYNCSAGQDRTGFTTAMILMTLGVPYETIVTDYHLSTKYRRPENEMPKFDAAMIAANPIARYFAKYQSTPQAAMPQPLKTAEGQPFLDGALAEIKDKWGSVENYLQHEAGVGPVERSRLRAMYLE